MKKLFLAAALLIGFGFAANAQSFNQRAVVSAASSGDNTLIASVAGKSIYVYGYDLTLASSTFLFKCGAVAQTGAMTFTTYFKDLVNDPAYFVCPAGTALVGTLGSAVQLSGVIWYKQQ